MGARLINNPRRTKIGHVEAFPVLHMRSLRKSAMFSEGQRTEGHLRYPGASNAITIIVDLRSEHDLKVLLKVGHADSATNMQVKDPAQQEAADILQHPISVNAINLSLAARVAMRRLLGIPVFFS